MMSAAARSSPLLPRASCKTLQTTGFVINAVCGRRTEVSARSAAGNSRRNTLRGGRQVRLVAGAFIDPGTGYAYQYEWSNANSGCVKTR